MEPRPSTPQEIYNATLEACISEFEALPNLNALEAAIDERCVGDEVQINVPEITVDNTDLPPAIAESHYFPRRFAVSDFSANLKSRTEQHAGPDDYTLHMHYTIGTTPYTFSSTPQATHMRTENYEGGALQYQFPPKAAGHLLAVMAATSLQVDVRKFSKDVTDHELTSRTTLQRIMHVLGSHGGVYTRQRTAQLPFEDNGRILVAKLHEFEVAFTEDEQKLPQYNEGRKLECHVAWQTFGSATTETVATQSDIINPLAIESNKFATRRSTNSAPEDLLTNVQREVLADSIGAFFDSDTSTVRYAEAVAAILPVLHHYMEPYKQLD